MKRLKPIRTPDATYLHLNKNENFQRFFRGLINYLQNNLTKVEIQGVGIYYTCGQAHERYNQNWKTFQHLWNYTDKKGLDFYAVKDLLDEFFFRELKCDCEVLCDDKEIRRRELENSGVYLGDPGKREVDIF